MEGKNKMKNLTETAKNRNTALNVVLYLLLCGLMPFLYWIEDYIRIEYIVAGTVILMYAFALLVFGSSKIN